MSLPILILVYSKLVPMLGMIVEIQREKTKPFEKIVLVLQRIRKLYSYASNITANFSDAWKEVLEDKNNIIFIITYIEYS